MKIINVEQRSKEWHALRATHLGASTAPVICLKSEDQTPYGLWSEMLGLTPPRASNQFMKRGIDLEPVALQLLNKYTGRDYEPSVIVHEKISYLMASLDGLTSDHKHIAEIKCPGKKDHDIALSGLVPEQYFAQLQHQIECSGLDEVEYFSFDGTDGVIINVPRDQEFIDWMLEKEYVFWECLKNLEPPELTDRDYIQRRDEAWNSCVCFWKKMNHQLKEAQNQEKLARDLLIQLSGGQNCQGSGLKLSQITRKGSIAYELIPEIRDVDLEKFRKKNVVSWRISTND